MLHMVCTHQCAHFVRKADLVGACCGCQDKEATLCLSLHSVVHSSTWAIHLNHQSTVAAAAAGVRSLVIDSVDVTKCPHSPPPPLTAQSMSKNPPATTSKEPCRRPFSTRSSKKHSSVCAGNVIVNASAVDATMLHATATATTTATALLAALLIMVAAVVATVCE